MIYLYDQAIADDLTSCINSDTANNTVKVIGSEGILPIVAQIQEDKIKFPLICLYRHEDTPVDTTRTNFTAMKRGVASVVDPETHMIYMEKVMPIILEYDLTILATNTVDIDEIVKELLFHYSSMYFLTIKNLPYESNRSLRFGVRVDPTSIKRTSGAVEYVQGGTLYQTQMVLSCDGAVLLSYTPKHLLRYGEDDEIVVK